MRTLNEIIEALRNSDVWEQEDCRDLCELADMTAEWEAADGDTFENVVNEAAEKLGVTLYEAPQKTIADGWHTVCGIDVMVEDGKIKRGLVGAEGHETTGFVYRKSRRGGWDIEYSISVPAFRSGFARGTIRVM